MSDDSEEKVLPPSEHKLRKAREKGQVASSQDFVAAAVTLSALLYVVFAWPSMVRAMDEIFRLTVASAPFTARDGLGRSFHSVLYLLGGIVVPFGIVTALAAIVANMIHKRGIPFSVHPVIPDFSRINPGQMMKKVFSKRNATEFGISLFRITVWFVVAGLVLWLAATDILASATCGGPCIGNIAVRIGIVLFAALFNGVTWWFSDRLVLRMYRARELSREDAPDVWDMVDRLRRRAGLPMPKLALSPSNTSPRLVNRGQCTSPRASSGRAIAAPVFPKYHFPSSARLGP